MTFRLVLFTLPLVVAVAACTTVQIWGDNVRVIVEKGAKENLVKNKQTRAAE